MLKASAQAVDFKVGRYFGEGQGFACSSPFGNLANFPLVHIRDFYQFVDQEIVIAGFQDVLDYRSDTVPLFVAGQAPLAEDNQTRVYLNVEKPDKIASVACDDHKVIFEA
jgi:hypothetical protein